MKKLVLLMLLIVLAAPLAADAHIWKSRDRNSVSISDNSTFEIEDGELTLTHRSRHTKDRVIVTADGDLTVNGDKVRTDDGERKLLRKFYRESARLEEMAEDIAADAERIAAASTEFAAVTLTAVLRSLTDDDSEADEDEVEAIEADFEEEMEFIEKIADKIETQADKVVDIADELQERIPELDELDWFLDD